MFHGRRLISHPLSTTGAARPAEISGARVAPADMMQGEGESADMRGKIHACVKKVTEDYERMKYNTAIAAMMTLVNDFYAKGSVTRDELHTLLTILSPVAPHMAEEMNETLGFSALYREPWPVGTKRRWWRIRLSSPYRSTQGARPKGPQPPTKEESIAPRSRTKFRSAATAIPYQDHRLKNVVNTWQYTQSTKGHAVLFLHALCFGTCRLLLNLLYYF
jgi:hypothetical protein